MATTTEGLCTVADFLKRYPTESEDVSADVIQDIIFEATEYIEDFTGRRLAPFVGMVDEQMMFGLDPDEYGDATPNIPLPFQGSLGVDYANALGANDLVRHFWLEHYAPMRPELWRYNIQSVNLYLTYGNTQPLDITSGGLIGDSPEVTTGHCWIRLGTFAPEGTRLRVTYDGGYTEGIPLSLRRACLFQTAKFLVLENESRLRAGTSIEELDNQISMLLAPWMRI